MKYHEFLLSDEANGINEQDYLERKAIVEELNDLPEDFFAKMRHFQPQIGCLNACKICSKVAGTTTTFWTEKRQRNVIAAIKHVTSKMRHEKPLIVWDRNEHRSGVIFSYLDNDIGNYYYLDSFIKLLYDELGVTTRISTVGYSRHNSKLNEVHARINKEDMMDCLAGVRLSFTPYAIGWSAAKNYSFSRYDYAQDMANFLKMYRPYYKKTGAGSRNMCVEIRYKPLVELAEVFETEVLRHKVIYVGNYLYISQKKDVSLELSQIADPYAHSIVLTQEPVYFYSIDLYKSIDKIEEVKRISHKFIMSSSIQNEKLVEVYLFSNFDGRYYAIEPKMKENGNFGINIYPKTENRVNSGYIVTERFLVNAMIEYKHGKGISSLDTFADATWRDVYNVIDLCLKYAKEYQEDGKTEKAEYITEELLPMISAYIFALQEAGYEPKDFFNPNFTIDTGIICNMGRALSEFKGITGKENEPLTPTHERNYGNHNSTMTKEGNVWRLSCNYGDTILVEKLSLADTSSEQGQTVLKKIITLPEGDETLRVSDLKNSYLVPGQRR